MSLTTIAISTVGSVLPFSPIEPFLLALPAVAPRGSLVPLALLATVCHMGGKLGLYYASRGAARAIPRRYESHVEKTRQRLLAAPWVRFATILASGVVGLPPFYVVTMLCGALRVSVAEFLVLGTIGRALRFVALATVPSLFGG